MRVATAATLAGALACAACGGPSASAPPAPSDALHEAFEAAFGKPAPYASLDDSGDRVVYTPQALISVAPGTVALVSKGEIPGGCKACAGSLNIDYLRQSPAGFARLGSWPHIAGLGPWGAALPWTVRADLDDGPTLVTRLDDREATCSATTNELITLRPSGPVKIATVVVATALRPGPGESWPARHVAGTITPIVRGQRFAVVLRGTDPLRQVFERHGEVFTTSEGGATGC